MPFQNTTSISAIAALLDIPLARELAASFVANKKKSKVDLGFNAFALVSDVYHRENLHSDVLAAILSPQGEHKCGGRFLELFLGFLRTHHGVDSPVQSFGHAVVSRESGRMDLLIHDEMSRCAIIVENKINGAGDMDCQIPRYLDEVRRRGYDCRAIVYLTLNYKGSPDKRGWSEKQRQEVGQLLHPIVVFNDSPGDLCTDWLDPCIKAAESPEVAPVLTQYRQLLLKLGQNVMNQPLMEQYCELLKDQERFAAAESLAAMWKDLPAYRGERLREAFRGNHAPFWKVQLYEPWLVLFEGLDIKGGKRVKIHVDTSSPTETRVSLWDNDDESNALPKRIVKDLGLTSSFSVGTKGWLDRRFRFPAEETALIEDLRTFLDQLRDYVKAGNRAN